MGLFSLLRQAKKHINELNMSIVKTLVRHSTINALNTCKLRNVG